MYRLGFLCLAVMLKMKFGQTDFSLCHPTVSKTGHVMSGDFLGIPHGNVQDASAASIKLLLRHHLLHERLLLVQ